MRLADKVQEWLNAVEWEDDIERDEEAQTSGMTTGYSIEGQSYKLWIETDEKREWIKLYLYAPINVQQKKRAEVALLFNHINTCRSEGSLQFLQNGKIVFRHTIDVENAQPSVEMINNMLSSASGVFESWFEEISAVALTKTTAQEIFDQLEEASQGDGVTSEI